MLAAAATVGLVRSTAPTLRSIPGCGIAARPDPGRRDGRSVVVQLGPRSWYTAATPVVVLAALIGGPLLGVAAGVATQLIRPSAVWRRRAAEGGDRRAAGARRRGSPGLALVSGDGRSPVAVAAGAMVAAVAVNTSAGCS